MWTDVLSLNQIVVMGLVSAGAMAAWRETPQNEPVVRDVQKAIIKALQAADLSHKEAAHVLDTPQRDYTPQQWSLDLQRGGNLTALVIVGIRHPAFGTELATRLSALLRGRGSLESRVERCERLLAEVKLSQKKVTTCEVREVDELLVG